MLRIGSHPALHPVFETLAYAVGYAVFRRVRARQGDFLAEPQRWTVLAAAAIGALPRSRLLKELLFCLRELLIPKDLGYGNLFRVLIVQFIDAEAFDVRSVKKSCIHIAHPDGKRLIPFDTFNMFYRGDLESTRLAALRGLEMTAV